MTFSLLNICSKSLNFMGCCFFAINANKTSVGIEANETIVGGK